MTPKIVTTLDGSATLFSDSFDDHYHSMNGALSESMHIFIGYGLHEIMKTKQSVNILEIGFGTGLNALCTLKEADIHQLKINYIGIEPFPLDKEIAFQLNYSDFFDDPAHHQAYKDMHTHKKNVPFQLTPNFFLNIIQSPVQDTEFRKASFDLVYFDPFKPETQSDVWSPFIFSKIFHAMNSDGILVTYSSKGMVRKAMEEAGFQVEKLPGPFGKREISRASKESVSMALKEHLCECNDSDY